MGKKVIYLKEIPENNKTYLMNMIASGFEDLSKEGKDTLIVLLKAFLSNPNVAKKPDSH